MAKIYKSTRTLTLKRAVLIVVACTLISSSFSSESCSTSSDCSSSYFTCKSGECKHKNLWPPTITEIGGIIVLIFISVLASASGIGGGGIIVPLNLILLKFEAKEAIALSNGIILCNGLTKSFIGLFRSHPTIPKRTIIDYNIILVLMPSILLGAFIGSIVGEMAPTIFQLALLLVILFFTVLKSLSSGI